MGSDPTLESFRGAYAQEAWHSPKGRAIREVVFGANDGLVTTLGFVMGVYGATRDHRLVVLTAIAEILAGTLSMGLGAYLSTKSQREYFHREIRREEQEIDELPEKEREEIREIYARKGFQGAELDLVVNRITADRTVWLRCMLEEELGLIQESFDEPVRAGVFTGVSYLLGGVIPILPYFIFSGTTALAGCVVFAVLGFFGLGAGRTLLTRKKVLPSGLEVVAIGLAAAGLGYLIGLVIPFLIKFLP